MNLEARGVHFHYGSRTVLEDVSVGVEDGAITALCGPNGAGKSTLLHLLAGLRAPSRGAVTLDGQPVARLRPSLRAQRIAVVPQAFETAFDLTVEDLVALGRLHRMGIRDRLLLRPFSADDDEAVGEALRRMELGPLRNRRLSQLSGGEKARVMIATALCQGADHVLLDEPTAHLDPAFRRDILEILHELARGGQKILVVLHDLMFAGLYADRVVLLSAGRLVACGDAAQVLREDLLQEVFRTPLRVVAHPESGRPIVLPG